MSRMTTHTSFKNTRAHVRTVPQLETGRFECKETEMFWRDQLSHLQAPKHATPTIFMKTNTRQLTSPSGDFDVRLRNCPATRRTRHSAQSAMSLVRTKHPSYFLWCLGEVLEHRGAQHACRQGQQLPLSSPGTLASPGHHRLTELPRPSPSGALPQGWKLGLQTPVKHLQALLNAATMPSKASRQAAEAWSIPMCPAR